VDCEESEANRKIDLTIVTERLMPNDEVQRSNEIQNLNDPNDGF
jgi:hypothetical protein